MEGCQIITFPANNIEENVYLDAECLTIDFQRALSMCVSPDLPMILSSEGNLFSLKTDFRA